MRHAAGAGLAVLALALGVGCAPPPALDVAPAEAQTVSLYERLGGLPAITAVVDDFIVRLKKDPVVKDRFEALNVPRFRAKLIEQVGELSGGPQRYTGIDMLTLHTGMDITEEEFNAVVGDLTGSLNAFRVPEREQGEMLAALGQLKDQIVAPPVSTEQRLDTMEALLGRIDTRVDELLRRLRSDATPRASAPAPSRRIAAKPATPAAPSQGAQSKGSQAPAPQRWTEAERDLVPELIARYEKASRAPNVGKRRDLVGRPLAYTRFLQDDGEVLDLDDLRGTKVVLIIMRGFAGAVCLHCSTQMLALVKNLGEFERRKTRVFVVYPGEAATVPAFMESVRALDPNFRPPFRILLDVDLAAVRAFLIEGSLAKPTTLIVDESGIVRWAYVGQQPSDRPSMDLVLRQLDLIPSG
ncbi:MAG: redoxin domain-containing protein [Gammaproteobacteria bacterium]